MAKYTQALFDSYNNVVKKIQNFPLPWQQITKRPFRMSVVTGDKKGAGTDANVFIVVYDAFNQQSRKLEPKHTFKDDHERGTTTHYDFDLTAGVEPPFQKIEVWRDDWGGFQLPFGLGTNALGGKTKNLADWFLDRVEIRIRKENIENYDNQNIENNEIQNNVNNEIEDALDGAIQMEGNIDVWVFPVHRWIRKYEHYFFPLHDSLLPQYDQRSEFRETELEDKRKNYTYIENVKGGPVQVNEIPDDENFSEKFYWTFVEKKAKLMALASFVKLKTKWKSLEDVKELLKICKKIPQSVQHWKEDRWFALQRLQGVDATIIRLCREIPSSIDEPEDMKSLLEGKTLTEAAIQNRIFICNLSILEGIQGKSGKKIGVPIALFYLNNERLLRPVLIQLQQEKSSENPVFTPLDPPSTWLVAKMYYNNSEAQFHQAVTHLGFTHLIMEGVCATCHRNLSASHPIFRLLAPHFLYLIAINKRGEEKLINPGGWVDSTMTQGTEGMMQLMAKQFNIWTFLKTNPVFDFAERGVLEESVLPQYPYRDDAVKLYRIIRKYVKKIISRYYDSTEKLKEDWEIQNFRRELVTPFPRGTGIRGVPGDDSQGFVEVEQLIETISGIISTCSLGHAAANSQQYEQYAFVPNYPGTLSLDPPTRKVEYTDDDILSLLPSKTITLDTVVITSLLSSPITNSLGDFEVQYLYHPEDIAAADTFREDLKALSQEIVERNERCDIKYVDLDPQNVPNSISI